MIVIPVYNVILAPKSTVYMGLEQVQRSAGERVIIPGERIIMIVARENESFSEMKEENQWR